MSPDVANPQMTAAAFSTDHVTLSTKCWEGDYREVLTERGLRRLFGAFGPAAGRQVVINRVLDRDHAQDLGSALVADGLVDRVAFAEDHWPAVAEKMGLPVTWFGAAWPSSVPEVVELYLCQTPLIAHVAGDVGLEDGPEWLPVALGGFAAHRRVVVVAPRSPSDTELEAPSATLRGKWILTQDFLDQCFVAQRDALLSPEVLRACHWSTGQYPKPGGALTFEARVGAWLRSSGAFRVTDQNRRYEHPIHGREGDNYREVIKPWLPVVEFPGSAYPPKASVPATGLIIVRNGERGIAAAVASLAWCSKVLVLDQESDDATADRARLAGAEVRRSAVTGVVEPARLDAVAQIGSGWVVMLDADEMMSASLAHKLANAMHPGSSWDAVRLARKNMIFGRWARGAGWWPDPQLRVFKAELVQLPKEVHGEIRIAAGARCLDLVEAAERQDDLALWHFNYTGYADWFDRLNRYTTMHARTSVIKNARPGVQFVRSFLKRFFANGGWRLGRYGFDISVLGASYEWLLVHKTAEYAAGGEPAVQAMYDEIAAQVLKARVANVDGAKG